MLFFSWFCLLHQKPGNYALYTLHLNQFVSLGQEIDAELGSMSDSSDDEFFLTARIVRRRFVIQVPGEEWFHLSMRQDLPREVFTNKCLRKICDIKKECILVVT